MAQSITKLVWFGSTKTGLTPTVKSRLYYPNATPASPEITGVGGGIVHLGNGWYKGVYAADDEFTTGYVHWNPDDGGVTGPEYEDINLLTALDLEGILSGLGAVQVNVTVEDQDGAPVPGVILSIMDNSGVTVLTWGRTDSNGQKSFNLNAGDYKLRVESSSRYGSVADANVAVAAPGPVAVAVVLTEHTVSPPIAPGLCVVRIRHYLNGIPVKNARCEAKVIKQNSATTNNVLSLQQDLAFTNELGLAELHLVRLDQFTAGDGKYRFKITDPTGVVSSEKDATVPNADSADYYADIL